MECRHGTNVSWHKCDGGVYVGVGRERVLEIAIRQLFVKKFII